MGDIRKNTKESQKYENGLLHEMRNNVSSILGLVALAKLDVHNPEYINEQLDSIAAATKAVFDNIDSMQLIRSEDGEEASAGAGKGNIVDKLMKESVKNGFVIDSNSNLRDFDEEYLYNLKRLDYMLEKIYSGMAWLGSLNGVSLLLSARNISGTDYVEFSVFSDEICIYDKPYVRELLGALSQGEEYDIHNPDSKQIFLELKLVGEILSKMNGDIRIMPEHRSFRFDFKFSLKRAANQTQETEKILEKAEEVNVSRYSAYGAGMNILLVEDNEISAEISKATIVLSGANVEWALNGIDAVNMVKASSEGYYDLILMDLQMPELDGFLATSAIRRLKRADAAKIPILALTADVLLSDVQKARNAGMDDYLLKPMEAHTLDRIIQKYKGSRA